MTLKLPIVRAMPRLVALFVLFVLPVAVVEVLLARMWPALWWVFLGAIVVGTLGGLRLWWVMHTWAERHNNEPRAKLPRARARIRT